MRFFTGEFDFREAKQLSQHRFSVVIFGPLFLMLNPRNFPVQMARFIKNFYFMSGKLINRKEIINCNSSKNKAPKKKR